MKNLNRKRKVEADDESIDDEASETGWNSDEDAFITGKADYADEDDFDDEEWEGEGMLISDALQKNIQASIEEAPTKKKAKLTKAEKAKAKRAKEAQAELEAEEQGGDAMEEEVEEGDHDNLLKAIQRFSNADETLQQQKSQLKSFAQTSESTFLADSSKSLGLQALLGQLDSSKVNALKSQLKSLDSKTTTPKFVEKVTAERIEREQTYQTNKEEMSKWHETILDNRNTFTLDLSQDKRHPQRMKTLIHSFTPQTDFEREINMVVLKSGASDEAQLKRETELLVASNISPEEIVQRQAELSRVKALLFYEQMKRHRVNKIKSKAYRAVQRRAERNHQASADPEDDTEAVNRIKERMSLRHKSTSKWAKMALRRQGNDHDRDAYHESVRLGHELTQRMDEGNQSEDEDLEAADEAQEAENDAKPAYDGKYRKLFEMDFMKRASDQQMDRAKEEAQAILREIRGLDVSDNEGEDGDRDDDGKEEEQEEQKEVLVRSNRHSSLRTAGISLDISTVSSSKPRRTEEEEEGGSGGDSSNPWLDSTAGRGSDGRRHTGIKSTATTDQNAAAASIFSSAALVAPSKGKGGKELQVAKQVDARLDEQDQVTSQSARAAVVSEQIAPKADVKKGKKGVIVDTKVQAKVAGKVAASKAKTEPQQVVAGKKRSLPTDASNTASATAVTSNKKRKATLSDRSQQELLQMAFQPTKASSSSNTAQIAGPDYEDDFQQLKRQTIDRELGLDDKRIKVLKDGTFNSLLIHFFYSFSDFFAS